MKVALPLAAMLLVAVAACDNPKPRRAVAPVVMTAAVPTRAPPASTGLLKRPEMAGFSLDVINEAADPLNTPARIKAGVATTFSGFGFDPVTKTAGKAIDIVVDGVAYGTECCQARPDVATYFKNEALTLSGFRVTLLPDAIKRGKHTVVIRVVSADGKAFNDSIPLSFSAR